MESAMTQVADKYTFEVSWEPFLLRPGIPDEGMVKPPQMRGVSGRLKEQGEKVGINFTGKCERAPNTARAHVLLEYVKETMGLAKQDELQEALFKAYFTDGVHLDVDGLVSVATQVGIDAAAAREVVSSEDRLKAALQVAAEWSKRGVDGVPAFYMNGQKTFSGAQDIFSFIKMFEVVSEKFPLPEAEEAPKL